MTADPYWSQGSGPELLDFVDRQFAFVGASEHEAGDGLLRWVTVLRRLDSDPRVAGILWDVAREGEDLVSAINADANKHRSKLVALWKKHRKVLAAAEGHSGFSREPFGSVAGFAKRVNARTTVAMPRSPRETDDPTDVLDDILALQFWASHARPGENRSAATLRSLDSLERDLNQLRARHVHVIRDFHARVRTTAAPALFRLRELAQNTNPAPRTADEDPLMAAARRMEPEKLAKAIHTPQQTSNGQSEVRQATAALFRDTRILHMELRTRIGLTRSRLALLDRFIARCQVYDAPRLREIVGEETTRKRADGRPVAVEGVLTAEMARFLFEQGLNPLVDPKLVGLRPDVFDQSTTGYTLYVEAKQYSSSPRSPRRLIIEAVTQVFQTWQRLRAQFPVTEAFLLVFRVGGPLVTIDDTVRGTFGPLHIRVADIAPASASGSSAKEQTIRITAAELAPASSDSPTTTVTHANARTTKKAKTAKKAKATKKAKASARRSRSHRAEKPLRSANRPAKRNTRRSRA